MMSINFYFTARLRDKKTFFEGLDRAGAACGCAVYKEENTARASFCPLGNIFFTIEQNGEGSGAALRLSAECQTNLAGPGFHAAAIDFVDALAKESGLAFEVDDETDYYQDRDFARMRQKHFYSWLKTIFTICEMKSREEDCNDLCVCWGVDVYTPAPVAGSVVTPFGRFDIQKRIKQLQEEGVERLAQEFFFWNEREQDARFYRNIALNALWEGCYFMPGDRSEEDKEVNQTVIDLLEKAISMDRKLPVPKQEYLLLCRLNCKEPVDLTGTLEYEADYPIGFRRDMVTEKVGNISFPIHGGFLYEYEERGDHVWYDNREDGWHSVRMTVFRRNDGDAEFSERVFEGLRPVEEYEAGDGRCRAAFAGEVSGEEEETYYQMIGQVICGPQTVLITLSFQKKEEQVWGWSLFRGIKAKLPKGKNGAE